VCGIRRTILALRAAGSVDLAGSRCRKFEENLLYVPQVYIHVLAAHLDNVLGNPE
jgi:hypothetical protein